MRITFIGGGNMASAIIAGLSTLGRQDLQLHVVDRNPDKCERMKAAYGITYSNQLSAADIDADVVVLAIKPQQLKALGEQIRPWMRQQLIVSVAAGIRTATLAEWLGGYARIVRVMPNTPAQVQLGVSGLFATEAVHDAEKQTVTSIFEAVGKTVWLQHEAEIDKITAISGSGPAYVFYMIESLASAARTLGFAPELADLLAKETFKGAIALLDASGEPPATLRANVTSKKGTTEQGIMSLQEDGLEAIVTRAAQRAEARSIELGDQLSAAE